MLGLVDWHLITLFCGLFVVIRGMEVTGMPHRAVAWLSIHGVYLNDPLTLTGVSVVLSNLVSNVPASMLLIKFLDPADPVPWYVLAVSSTFAGNLITIGSIANLITIEQARTHGVRISFWEHARAGIPDHPGQRGCVDTLAVGDELDAARPRVNPDVGCRMRSPARCACFDPSTSRAAACRS
jgi:Na+/H+ antiporter NhaD/arsenite permease-like protein